MRYFRPAGRGVDKFSFIGITFTVQALVVCAVGLTTWAGQGVFSRSGLLANEPRNLLISDEITRLNILEQNWTEREANWFYGVPQGSKLIPYTWFLHLEQADSETLFRDATNIRSLGYLPRVPSRPENPDGLPIGFTRDGNHLGFTCAACHTNQINYQGQAWLVDGAPTLADFEKFLIRLEAALDQTLSRPEKFERFASRVLSSDEDDSTGHDLKAELRTVLEYRRGYNVRNLSHSGAPPFGPGRIDAFGAIVNEITTTFAEVPGNASPANAPVSYPFLWDTPHHDRVQWNGAAKNNVVGLLRPVIGTAHVGALGRNSGEVLGVFGDVDAREEGGLLNLRGYPSTVNRPNLIAIEEQLGTLWSPEWPAELPAIDETLRAQGERLYAQHCQSCHQPINRTDPQRTVHERMSAVGTDPLMAANFASRTARSGILEKRRIKFQSSSRLRATESVENLLTHMVQRVVIRRPLSPELLSPMRTDATAEFFANRKFSRGGLEGAPQFSSMVPSMAELTPEQAEAALQAVSEWDPDYRVYAEIKVDGQTLTGGFRDLEMSEGKVTRAMSPDGLRLLEDKKAYQLDAGAFGAEAVFVAPDGDEVQLETLSGVKHEFSSAGTRLTFDEAATPSFAYKGRPLNGIWATAPYLHNGSVPNLDELLKPSGQRVKQFQVGSREFDPINVGFVNEGNFEFDTTLPGNSNSGHEYGDVVFTEEERRQLIEYMKSL